MNKNTISYDNFFDIWIEAHWKVHGDLRYLMRIDHLHETYELLKSSCWTWMHSKKTPENIEKCLNELQKALDIIKSYE